MCYLLVIFYFMGNHRSYKTFVRVSRFFLKRRILLYDTTIFRYVLGVCKNYEAAVVNELEFVRDDFTDVASPVGFWTRSHFVPANGFLLLGSGVSFLPQAVSPRSMTPRNMKMYFSFIRSFVMGLMIY